MLYRFSPVKVINLLKFAELWGLVPVHVYASMLVVDFIFVVQASHRMLHQLVRYMAHSVVWLVSVNEYREFCISKVFILACVDK